MGIFALPAQHQVCQQSGGCHGGSHPPFVEPGGNIEIRRAFGILPDIGYTVQAHAVLRGPLGDDLRLGIISPGKGFQALPAAGLAGAMAAAA